VTDCLVYSLAQGPSVTLGCFQTALGLTGCQIHCILQRDWLHKLLHSLKISALPPFAWTAYVHR